MPRRLVYHSQSAGDPQTLLQDDKDPMLSLNPDYLDCNSDADPAGDLGEGEVSGGAGVGTEPIILFMLSLTCVFVLRRRAPPPRV